jgi:Domain of unknown function (DUF4440)
MARIFASARLPTMKRCDTCKRHYADSLQYCLQDGTVLSPVTDPQAPTLRLDDQQATLRIEARPTNTKVRVQPKIAWGLFAIAGVMVIGFVGVVALIIFLTWSNKTSADGNQPSNQPERTNNSSPGTSNNPGSKADAERQLIQLNDDIGVALVRKDVPRLDGMLANDYRYVGDGGLSLSKSDIFALYNSNNLYYDYLTTSDPKVDVTSDLTKGTVTGHARSKGRLRGIPFMDSYFYRNSYEARDGRWQLVNGVSWH